LSASDFITLAGGLTVPLEPLMLALDLESRGVDLSVEGDQLLVRPQSAITDDDRQQLRRWKRHLIALVSYEPPTHIN
jgi:hypothetical protein